jgi:hypothetical protein
LWGHGQRGAPVRESLADRLRGSIEVERESATCVGSQVRKQSVSISEFCGRIDFRSLDDPLRF